MLNYKRYKRVPVVNFPERTWPNKEIEKALYGAALTFVTETRHW